MSRAGSKKNGLSRASGSSRASRYISGLIKPSGLFRVSGLLQASILILVLAIMAWFLDSPTSPQPVSPVISPVLVSDPLAPTAPPAGSRPGRSSSPGLTLPFPDDPRLEQSGDGYQVGPFSGGPPRYYWSPDGKYLAVSGWTAGGRPGIWLVSGSGRSMKELSVDFQEGTSPGFSGLPDSSGTSPGLTAPPISPGLAGTHPGFFVPDLAGWWGSRTLVFTVSNPAEDVTAVYRYEPGWPKPKTTAWLREPGARLLPRVGSPGVGSAGAGSPGVGTPVLILAPSGLWRLDLDTGAAALLAGEPPLGTGGVGAGPARRFLAVPNLTGDKIALQTVRGVWGSLRLVDAATGNPVVVWGGGSSDLFPTWSPGGERLAFLSDDPGVGGFTLRTARQEILPAAPSLVVAGVDGTRRWKLTAAGLRGKGEGEEGAAEALLGIPMWAPEGDHLALLSGTLPREDEEMETPLLRWDDLWVISMTGQEPSLLPRHLGVLPAPDARLVAWTPGGDGLLIAAGPVSRHTAGDLFKLYYVPVSGVEGVSPGRGRIVLAREFPRDAEAIWLPDGRLLYEDGEKEQDLFLALAAGSGRATSVSRVDGGAESGREFLITRITADGGWKEQFAVRPGPGRGRSSGYNSAAPPEEPITISYLRGENGPPYRYEVVVKNLRLQ